MNIQNSVKDYYGKVLSSSDELKTDACCTIEDTPSYLRQALANIHPEVTARYYGCGLIAPLAIEGCRVLDLGAGAGRDAYALAQLVGEHGEVVGVDMTPEQLSVARAHQDWHAKEFGYANTRFLEGDIERLDALGLEPASFDVIVSNCVINLVEDKEAVFRAAHALLKPGGEFYFADVYADRRINEDLRHDPIARGECLSGALYWNDFLHIAKDAGFTDPRLARDRPLSISNAALQERLAPAQFHAATYRLFKADGLESACEDYGQSVVYKGGCAHSDAAFFLDAHHEMSKSLVFPVCGNTFRILKQSRFAKYFDFIGDRSIHHGIFPGCGVTSPFGGSSQEGKSSGTCC